MLPEGWVDHHSRNLRKGRHSRSGQIYLVTVVAVIIGNLRPARRRSA